MIPYPFEYKVAKSLDEAFAMMNAANGKASFIAGGHSLVPAMKLRLSRPGTLIDISRISGLNSIRLSGNVLEIGGLVTHAEVAKSAVVRDACPGLAECAGGIGDAQVRNKGTIGGNIAHADPGSDYPGALIAFNATVVLTGPKKSREVPSAEFFKGLFETARESGEIVTAVRVPAAKGTAYLKFPNPASRYAVVGVGVSLSMSGGKSASCTVGVTGAADHAFRATAAEKALIGTGLDDSALAKAASRVAEGVEMLSDLSASSEFRAHLCGVMLRRAVAAARARA